jgi:hypothetical protein
MKGNIKILGSDLEEFAVQYTIKLCEMQTHTNQKGELNTYLPRKAAFELKKVPNQLADMVVISFNSSLK